MIPTRIYIILVITFVSFNGFGQKLNPAEHEQIKPAKKAGRAIYHSKEMKELSLLINLYRTNPRLLQSYIFSTYSTEIAKHKAFRGLRDETRKKQLPILKSSFGLHLAAWSHAIFNGITGKSSTKGLTFRMIFFLNLYPIMSYGSYGQHITYGKFDNAISLFAFMLQEPRTKKRLLDKEYVRIGISQKKHSKYEKSTVIVLSSRKLLN